MTAHRRYQLLAVATLVVAGLVRAPLEQRLTEGLREDKLLQQPLDLEVRKKVGQGFWAFSLGGLRTLVATVLNLRAFSHFENYEWNKVAENYDTIVQISPHNPYYWDTGHWHMAYNAAAYYQSGRSDLPEVRARGEWLRWINKGVAFLEEGVRQNPDNPQLLRQLGWIHMDPHKPKNYEKAAEYLGRAVATGEARSYVRRFHVMAMARTDKYIDEALPLARKIMEEDGGAPPTLLSLRFALEHRADPDIDSDTLAAKLFKDEEQAYRHLGNYYLDIKSAYPLNGVAPYLRKLEERLDIPREESVFTARRKLLEER